MSQLEVVKENLLRKSFKHDRAVIQELDCCSQHRNSLVRGLPCVMSAISKHEIL